MPSPRHALPWILALTANLASAQAPTEGWAYAPLRRPRPPHSAEADAPSAIDAFLDAARGDRGPAPNPAADRRTWLRRATLDLTGLPPTPEELARFLADEAPDARERVVDRLLASPRFGERWARHWLDVARFAESHGYEQDYDRNHAWPYRDFVVQAWNEDLPFDEFTRWQVAGDELAPMDPRALAATGFLGAGAFPTQLTEAEFERARYDEIDDMVATTGVAFLGLSTGCARCHDHKFDPLTQHEYYELAATFAHAIRSEVEVTVAPADPRAVAAWRARAQELDARRDALERTLDDDLRRWVQEHANRGAHPPHPVPAARVRLTLPGERRILTLAEVEVFANGENVAPQGRAAQVSTAFGGVASRAIDGNTHPEYARGGQTHTQQHVRDPWWELDLGRDVPIERIVVWNRGENLEDRLEGFAIALLDAEGREVFRRDGLAAPRRTAEIAVDGLTEDQRTANALLALAGDESADARERSRALFRRLDPRHVASDAERRAHAASQPRDRTATYQVTTEGRAPTKHHADERGFPHFYDQVFHLLRGDPHRKVEVAVQGFPRVLTRNGASPSSWERAPNHEPRSLGHRARLAHWLTDVERGAGALLARVVVNRLWQHHFGSGLVATPNDFGRQGDAPSHPELLEWLASTLVESHAFHLKPLHRALVLSAAYGRSPERRAAAYALDPENRALWRFAPRRLEAEAIRDAVLFTSGRLDETLGGPGTLDETMRRRSLYFRIKRSRLVPTMVAFDWPEHLVSIGRRPRTAVAPQALWFLNHDTARVAAEDLVARGERAHADARDRLTFLYELTLGRSPRPAERALARTFLAEQQRSYADAGHADPERAAWVDFAQALFALPEFRTLS